MQPITIHKITYIPLLGKREVNPIPIVPSEAITHSMMAMVGVYPDSLEQMEDGYGYYANCILQGVRMNYLVIPTYADDLEQFKQVEAQMLATNTIVYLVCTDDKEYLQKIDAFLHEVEGDNMLAVAYKNDCDELKSVSRKTDDYKRVFDFLKERCSTLAIVTPDSQTLPDCRDAFDYGHSFAATKPNTFLQHRILGDFSSYFRKFTQEELAHDCQQAIINADSYDRQEILLQQIKAIRLAESEIIHVGSDGIMIDQVNAPLIIASPYTNVTVRKMFKGQVMEDAKMQEVADAVNHVLSLENTHNYTFPFNPHVRDEALAYSVCMMQLFKPRSKFLDIAGMYHASFRSSPYIRLGFLGAGINGELAKVRFDAYNKTYVAKYLQSIKKPMNSVGRLLTDRLLSPQAMKMLKESPSQIVAMTDLPLEWMQIEGLPLSFTHDICRLPETPVSGLMTHYVIHMVDRFTIPEDICKHTLIVYGCRKNEFRAFQDEADKLAGRWGMKTEVCESVQAFYAAIDRHKPQLLIIDSHGDVDRKNGQSYIWFGKEKMYPNDIATHHCSAKMVFLSACNTAPTYEPVNTLANGFLDAGALCVTSAYMPLQVEASSTLYLRLLEYLHVCARTPMFRNWIAFLSHLLRTSFIQETFINANKKNRQLSDQDLARITGEYCERSMDFAKRRAVYDELSDKQLPCGLKPNLYTTTPHYLMYSTIGRADLLEFDCFRKNVEPILEPGE